ncbi:MAG: thiamine-phosphate kinase, partial [Verrucomicrobiota bacterium]|nr:thiamine-phosphate kinase [Verrucomicrobiota bacterium]
MKLAELREDEIVARLVEGFAAGKNVRVGVGDDCAVIGDAREKTWQLLKTDCVIGGIHFLPDAPPEKIGWKAMARPLSDIAAMGGLPQFALVTIAVPPQMELQFLKGVYRGIRKAAERFGVTLVGGETSRSPGAIFISVTLTGIVERVRCITRAGGRAGDLLYVTGQLGGSIRGKHMTFIPRIEEARWLTKNFSIRAMMDLSDGLGADLPRLSRASGVSFTLDESTLPITRG